MRSRWHAGGWVFVSAVALAAWVAASRADDRRSELVSPDLPERGERLHPAVHVRSLSLLAGGTVRLALAGGRIGTVHLSSDDGRTFAPAPRDPNPDSLPVEGGAAGPLYVDPSGSIRREGQAGSVLRGMGALTAAVHLGGGRFAAASFGRGVLVSNEGASRWEPRNQGLPNLLVTSLAVTPGGELLAGTFGGGVYRAPIGTLAWRPSSTGLEEREIQALAAADSGVVLAGTSAGLFVSQDRGSRWARASAPLARENVEAVAITERGTWLVGTWGDGLRRSTDRGRTWPLVFLGEDPRRLTAFALGPDSSIHLGTVDGSVFRRGPTDAAFVEVGPFAAETSIEQLAIAPDGAVYALVAYGLLRWDPGTQGVTRIAPPGRPSDLRGLAVGADGRLLVAEYGASSGPGGYVSRNRGVAFERLASPCFGHLGGGGLRGDPTGHRMVWSCECASDDGGASFRHLSQHLPGGLDLGLPASWFCLSVPGERASVVFGSNNTSSYGAFVIEPGREPRRAYDVGNATDLPRCAAIAANGTLFWSSSVAFYALAPGATETQRRAEYQPTSPDCLGLGLLSDGSIVRATSGGLLRSVDEGRSFAPMEALPPRVTQAVEGGSP